MKTINAQLDAQWRRAWHLKRAGKPSRAFDLMLRCATAGYLSAQVNVGYFYDAGIGVKKNIDKALYWYRRAARRGDASAANNIGIIYRENGRYYLATSWFNKAISMGDDEAYLELAKNYLLQDRSSADFIRRVKRCLKKVADSSAVTEHSREIANRLLKKLKN